MRPAPYSAPRTLACLVACLLLAATGARAEDWPEFRGKGRLGVWTEAGILERFPEEGLDIAWRTRLNRGYTGPAVADGRVFVSDFARTCRFTASPAPRSWTASGVRQLIVWHPVALSSLDPETGEVFWEQPFTVDYDMTVAVPVKYGSELFVTTFYNGPLMMTLDADRPDAAVHWKGESNSEILTEGLHSVLATPVILNGHIYGVGSYGQLRCLDAATGERIWETQAATVERARWTSAFIVRHEDRFFINNDRGDLIIARMTPEGYEEISRTHLIAPTSAPGNRRALKTVNWSHPAYANQHIYARNDEEIIAASLAAP